MKVFRRLFPKLAILLTVLFLISSCGQRVDTTELEAEISEVQRQLSLAKEDLAKYSGGLIHALATVNVKVLENSLAMLEQKRSSWINGIVVNYHSSDVVTTPNIEGIDGIREDIEETSEKLETAQATADRYSSGLIRTIALGEAATHRLTLAQLNQRLLYSKWDIPTLLSQGDERSSVAPAGPIVSDEEAL